MERLPKGRIRRNIGISSEDDACGGLVFAARDHRHLSKSVQGE